MEREGIKKTQAKRILEMENLGIEQDQWIQALQTESRRWKIES